MAKTAAAMSRNRRALAVPDVWIQRPPYANKFVALRLKRGRKVLQRTLTRDEAEFLVWMLGEYLWLADDGAATAKDALVRAHDSCWARAQACPLTVSKEAAHELD